MKTITEIMAQLTENGNNIYLDSKDFDSMEAFEASVKLADIELMKARCQFQQFKQYPNGLTPG